MTKTPTKSVEWHPYTTVVNAKGGTLVDCQGACDLLVKYRPHVVVIESLEGFTYTGNKGYKTKDTMLE
ncbi:MAG: hypothetical protein HRU15_00310, partial [Planctomycetes bacterium]|nr:hypothetical protein [Planctomycetota bacterium]